MSIIKPKVHLLKKLTQLCELDIHNIYFGTSGPPLPEGAFLQAVSRFNFILDGCRPMTLPLNGESVQLSLRAGDMHISTPNSWEYPQFTDAHEIICIVPRATYLRVATHEYYFNADG